MYYQCTNIHVHELCELISLITLYVFPHVHVHIYFSLPLFSLYIQVPEILRSLQVSVQAVLVGSPYETDWFEQGVPAKSLVDQWPLAPSLVHAVDRHSPAGSIASDSRYVYIHGGFGLMKLGSGYGNTIKVSSCVSDHTH